MKDRGDPMLILKEEQGHNNLSLETMKQNQNCQWNQDHCAKKTETNFKCYRRWRETCCDMENVHVCNNQLYSWERIT